MYCPSRISLNSRLRSMRRTFQFPNGIPYINVGFRALTGSAPSICIKSSLLGALTSDKTSGGRERHFTVRPFSKITNANVGRTGSTQSHLRVEKLFLPRQFQFWNRRQGISHREYFYGP